MTFTHSGGRQVKASELSVGDTIRDPRNPRRILVVESLGGQIFARGYEKSKRKNHVTLQPEQGVILVTGAETATTEGV